MLLIILCHLNFSSQRFPDIFVKGIGNSVLCHILLPGLLEGESRLLEIVVKGGVVSSLLAIIHRAQFGDNWSSIYN